RFFVAIRFRHTMYSIAPSWRLQVTEVPTSVGMCGRSFVAAIKSAANGTAESRALPFVPTNGTAVHRFLPTPRRPVENSCQAPFSPQFPLSLSLQPKYKYPKHGTITPFNLLFWI